MAFNWQTFRVRTTTSIIFVAVMLTGLLWNQWSFLILFSIIHFGCWWEYLRLMEKIHKVIFHPYVKMGFMVIGYSLLLWFCGSAYQIKGYGLKENLSLPVSGAGFAILLIGIFQKTPIKLKSFGAAALGLLYISVSWGLMMDLFRPGEIVFDAPIFTDKSKPIIPLIIISSLWINDTMAYIAGSLFGKTPLTKISPKKTWEGTILGIVLSVGIVGYLSFLAFNSTEYNVPVYKWLFIPAIAAITGTFGDLLESKLKRMANVKDSGRIMPGHGGFLDRFDSLLFAIPFVWLYINLFTR